MSAIVFVGPSLHGTTLPLPPEIVLRPPAAQGDVYRASLLRPRIIGLIDGYFENVPSVWHKEILWALSRGIAVYGSASMGALRAAELDVFGMTGIGEIYDWYRSGAIEDDDEVALLHGPAETGYVPLSEPAVNVRASCAAAVKARIIDGAAAETVVQTAKSLHYKERRWRAILDQAAASGLDPALGKSLAAWLDDSSIDQKQRDAITLIEAVTAALEHPMERRPANFRFEWTNAWDEAVRQWEADGPPPGTPQDIDSAVIDELRLEPDAYVAIRAQAVARAIVLARTVGHSREPDRGDIVAQLARLRQKIGLLRKSDLDDWVARNGLDAHTLESLLEAEARLDEARQIPSALTAHEILALLRLNDSYAGLAERARDKRRILLSTTFTEAGLPHGVTIPALINWYFAEKRKQPMPENLDSWMADLDLSSRTAFYRLLAAEYVYSATGGGEHK